MPTIDYRHDGIEHEYEASVYTLMLYEQEFKRDLIKDVFGRIDVNAVASTVDEDGNMAYIDYTIDNWSAYPRALWAMLRTSEDIARSEGRKVEPVPDFREWQRHARNVDLGELASIVIDECNRGLFHTGAAASE